MTRPQNDADVILSIIHGIAGLAWFTIVSGFRAIKHLLLWGMELLGSPRKS